MCNRRHPRHLFRPDTVGPSERPKRGDTGGTDGGGGPGTSGGGGPGTSGGGALGGARGRPPAGGGWAVLRIVRPGPHTMPGPTRLRSTLVGVGVRLPARRCGSGQHPFLCPPRLPDITVATAAPGAS
jgi:hypothetical protein